MKINQRTWSRSAPRFTHLKLEDTNGLLATAYFYLISLEYAHLSLPIRMLKSAQNALFDPNLTLLIFSDMARMLKKSSFPNKSATEYILCINNDFCFVVLFDVCFFVFPMIAEGTYFRNQSIYFYVLAN